MKETFLDEDESDMHMMQLGGENVLISPLKSPKQKGLFHLENLQQFSRQKSSQRRPNFENDYLEMQERDLLESYLNNTVEFETIRTKKSNYCIRDFANRVPETLILDPLKIDSTRERTVITFENTNEYLNQNDDFSSRYLNNFDSSSNQKLSNNPSQWNTRGEMKSLENNNLYFHQRPKEPSNREFKSCAVNKVDFEVEARKSPYSLGQSRANNEPDAVSGQRGRHRKPFSIQTVDQRSHVKRNALRSVPNRRRRDFDMEVNESYFHRNKSRDTKWIRMLSSDSDKASTEQRLSTFGNREHGLRRILSKEKSLLSSVQVSNFAKQGEGTVLQKYVNVRNTFGDFEYMRRNDFSMLKSDAEESSLNESQSRHNESVIFKRKIVTSGFENFLKPEIRNSTNSNIDSRIVSNRIKRLINLSKASPGWVYNLTLI